MVLLRAKHERQRRPLSMALPTYLRVDFDDDDFLIETLITSATRLCMDITRQDQDAFEESKNAKPAIYYAVAYLYEHREEADHHALTLTLRSLLFGSRKEAF